MSELMTVAETAEFLKVCEETVYAKVSLGAWPSLRVGRSIRIPKDALIKALTSTHATS